MYCIICYTDSVVTVEKIVEELAMSRANIEYWPTLGLLLGINKHEVTKIQTKYGKDAESCVRQLFMLWQSKYPKWPWNDILLALERHGKTHLATKLKLKYVRKCGE